MISKDQRLLWLLVRVIDGLLAAAPDHCALSPVQFLALRYIGLHDRPTLGAVAGALAISNAAATKLIDRLVRKELVDRAQGIDDRRERRLVLTGLGTGLLLAVVDAGERKVDEVMTRISEGDRAVLRRGAEAFLAAAIRTPTALQRICLRCGREHERDCPGDELFRRLGSMERQI